MDVVAAAAKREICHRVIYGVISPRFSAFFRLWEKKEKRDRIHGCLEELKMYKFST